ncbi:SDR family NAD(P)-dependent oxidoreductase [Microbacterium gorillae]|uniref:SDR family NAD(P)-dependent oxidoreductase n=1 Tax=Microbacterium gorillae TaxID=1231063 RepID=UPI000590E299|nr:SDR family oxidoreductase [Microbacterium gorillae]
MTTPLADTVSIADLISLRGRTAVIVGSAQGIGAATARRYAEAGANLILADLNLEAAEALASELAAKFDTDITAHWVDVSDEEAVGKLAEAAVERTGRLDVWVNFTHYSPMGREEIVESEEFPMLTWKRSLDVNLTGCYLGARAAARAMIAAGNGGVIINTTSTVTDRYPGHAGMLGYASSKGGIEQLTMILAAELGKRGIRALALKPTVIDTPGVNEHLEAVEEASGRKLGTFEDSMPMRRYGKPDEVARVALFAASDMSAFMTGSILTVDGGELTI